MRSLRCQVRQRLFCRCSAGVVTYGFVVVFAEVVEFEEAVKLAEAHVAAVRDELRKNSVLPPAEPSAPSSPPVVFKPSQPNSPEAAAVTVTLHIGDVDGALTSITRELAEQKERVRQMLRQSKYIQQCTGAPSKAPVECEC